MLFELGGQGWLGGDSREQTADEFAVQSAIIQI